jgi:hypothetical protein
MYEIKMAVTAYDWHGMPPAKSSNPGIIQRNRRFGFLQFGANGAVGERSFIHFEDLKCLEVLAQPAFVTLALARV